MSQGDELAAPRTTVAFGPQGYAAQQGKMDDEPHGCQWLKQVTGSGGEQTVKVVRNGEGGTKRAWNPATR
jgi:hypothetical protein